ncbi:MAG: transglycosylase SLT domain-containing protein [Chloroflexota bacterium]
MTVNTHTIWQLESPLNQEQELQDSIHILDYEQPPTSFPLSSLQQRMYVILGVATLLVFIFGIFVIPFVLRSISATIASAEPLANSVNQFQQRGVPVVAADSAISPIFSPEVQYWAPQIENWANAQNLDPNMVATVMQIESCGDPNALSPAGAQGLFQVMPYHFAANENAMNPDTNALRGLGYLSERLVQTNGDAGKAFAGYNGGHVAAGSDFSSWSNETQRYFRWSTTIYADAQAGLTESPALAEWLNAGGASLCQQAANRLNLR